MLPSVLAAVALAAAHPAPAQLPPPARPALLNPQMDYDSYRDLIAEVRPYRLARLIDWDAFIAAADAPGVLLLDARSERQFAEGHIAGAVNVPLTEFSEERLAEVIGRFDRPIIIYCNNNFRDDRPPVILKTGRVALNLSTFTHLYAYGYRNLRELNDVMDIDDPRVRWVTGPAAAGSSQRAAPRR